MKRLRGTGSLVKRGNFWWAMFYQNGQQVRLSTKKTVKADAAAWLAERLRAAQTDVFDFTQRASVADLMAAVIADYTTNHKHSLDDAQARWAKHLQPVFGGLPVAAVTTEAVQRYTLKRQGEGAADATVNRELALLKRAFSLGRKSGKVRVIPYIPMLREDNVRTGFLENGQYAALATVTAKRGLWLRAMFECGYKLGWRVGELKGLRVSNVDLMAREIRLEPGTTKNREGRTAVMPEGLYNLIVACVIGKAPTDYLFDRGGKAITDFRGAWSASCAEAGVPDLLFHDLRRSAIRNMVRAGISETVAMKISGHNTRSVFDRYDVTSGADLREAARKLESPTPDKAQYEHNHVSQPS